MPESLGSSIKYRRGRKVEYLGKIGIYCQYMESCPLLIQLFLLSRQVDNGSTRSEHAICDRELQLPKLTHRLAEALKISNKMLSQTIRKLRILLIRQVKPSITR